jgi:threonine dehydratase
VDAVRAHGATVDLIDVAQVSRFARVSELSAGCPEAYIASAYDDDLVIEGNSTLADEVCGLAAVPEVIVAPVGGGGLTAGLVRGVRRSGRDVAVVGAEPLLANDAARSLREGRLVKNDAEPQSLADGTRTLSLGERNWDILRDGLASIVEVEEETIREAVCLLFLLANLKVEPTGALSVAACMTSPDLFRGRSICCVVSGGNVDPALYADLIRDA